MLNKPEIDILYYVHKIADFFMDNYPYIIGLLKAFVGLLIAISIPLAVVFFVGIIFTVEGIKMIRKREEEKYSKKDVEPAYIEDQKGDPELSARWNKIQEHINSGNENDWKQAIIEADIILDSLLTKLGYQGDNVGEKLKRAEKGDFKTRQLAWDAHMVRNRIAHDGSSYPINQVEARKVIALYRQVFEEFYHL